MPNPLADCLVVQLARFGDLVQSKRLVCSLEAQGKRAHLCLDHSLAALARIVYPNAVLHPMQAHAGNCSPAEALEKNLKCFAELKDIEARQGFSAVYILNRSPLASAVAGLFPPGKLRGYRLNNRQAESALWSKLAGRWTKNRPAAPLNLVDFWAWCARRPHGSPDFAEITDNFSALEPTICKPHNGVQEGGGLGVGNLKGALNAQGSWGSLPQSDPGPIEPGPIEPGMVNPPARPARSGRIGVVLSGRESRRSLPVEELAACVQAVFIGRGGPEIVLLGSKAERAAARRLSRLFSGPMLQKTRDLSGETALTDLPEVLRGLDLLLTPDTGTMHLAAHLGVPVLAFFLSSAWCFETGPYGLGHQVRQAVAPCGPCLESAACPHNVACLAPFRHKAFLDHLAGRPNPEWPNGMVGLVSTLDKCGVNYLPIDGEDPFEEQRALARRLVEDFLFAEKPAPEYDECNRLRGLAAEWFTDTDWVLPQF